MSKAITFASRNEMFLLSKEWPKRDHLLGLALSYKLERPHTLTAGRPQVGKQILAEAEHFPRDNETDLLTVFGKRISARMDQRPERWRRVQATRVNGKVVLSDLEDGKT